MASKEGASEVVEALGAVLALVALPGGVLGTLVERGLYSNMLISKETRGLSQDLKTQDEPKKKGRGQKYGLVRAYDRGHRNHLNNFHEDELLPLREAA